MKVSVIIPARNEEKWIRGCLDSVLSNDFPRDRLEVLVVDGMSEDRTKGIVRSFASDYPFIRMVDNPQRIIPTALNIGIREARGEIIVRMDAHTTYATDYIRQAVLALETSGAAMVGAVQTPTGDTAVTRAIASATNCPFGVGNSYYHYGQQSRWVEDSVYLGVWYKRTLTELGGFNEKWLVNEDSELNHRVRQAGGKILLSVSLRCSYHVRCSLTALGRQYFRYGMWRAKTFLIHPSSLGWRQLVPPVFVVCLLLSLAVVRISPLLALLVPCAYVLVNLLVSAAIMTRKGGRHFLVPIAFSTIHISWGIGFLVGLARFSATCWKRASELRRSSWSTGSGEVERD
jgi:succinoglycan biosynthesis protein ExoA